MRVYVLSGGLTLMTLVVGLASTPSGASGANATVPALNPAEFTTRIDNPYLPWDPGTVYVYRASHGGGDVVTVTHRTKKVAGIKCVVVRDTDRANGRPTGRSLDWYAQDRQGNVWYFGEATSRYVHGHWVHDPGDSWRTGIRNARPGILMEAHPRRGDRYRQEIARADDALDTAKVRGFEEALTVPYGTFENVLKIKEFSPLEPGSVDKDVYARGIGELAEFSIKGGEGKSVLVSVRH
jgi:hypothetical protein